MSYILEALRKSETERKQGQIPSLGSSVQIIHKPQKTGSSPVLWGVLVALLLNGGLLAWLFWPQQTVESRPLERQTATAPADPGPVSSAAEAARQTPQVVHQPPIGSPVIQQPDIDPGIVAVSVPGTGSEQPPFAEAVATRIEPVPEPNNTIPQPMLINPAEPSVSNPAEPASIAPAQAGQGADDGELVADSRPGVAMLGSKPLGFQRQIPDLEFNSHIFSSRPDARRIMINGQYLREGSRFEDMIVEQITEDGVVLSLQGDSFAVSVVHNWNRPR